MAYAVGLLAVLLPATTAAWLAATAVGDALLLFWLAAMSAGLGTLVPWWVDGERRARYRAEDAADSERLGAYAE